MKNKNFWVIGIVVVAIVLLLLWPKLFSTSPSFTTGVPCLKPNIPLVQHIHPQISIMVDGEEEAIPADIGVPGGVGATNCEYAIHTHDTTGEIHVESQDTHEYTLGEFFSVWGKPLTRDGYTLSVTVDGLANTELGDLLFKDQQQIVLTYVKQ